MRNRRLYPRNWPVIARRCRERAEGKCEQCGIEHQAERLSRKGNVYRVALAACHKHHDQRWREDAELICLCEICHWWHDFLLDQLECWRRLEHLKHARLTTPERIEQARVRACARAARILVSA